MKNIFTLCLLILTNIQLNAQCYELVWRDEFDGTTLDDTKWSYQNGGWNGSNVQNCYDPANASVSGGSLRIEARHQPGFDCFGSPRDFTSGFVQTKNRIDWTFGRFEARIKMPASNSTWPAFWMSPQNSVYGSWPRSGEIDITEIKGHDMTKTYGNAHWGNSAADKQQEKQTYTFPAGNGADNWHIYTVEWKLGQLDFYIDGNYYGTINNFDEPNATTHPGPFDIDFYLRLNVAVGGNYLNAPWNDANNGIAQLPATMEVDWVRVYQDLGNCPPTDCELVQNGDFTNGTTDWTLYKYGAADGNLSITGNGYAKIDVTNSGTSSWHLALRQSGLFLENGKTYYVRMNAYADAPRSCPIIIGKTDGTQYAYISQSLTTTPTAYEYQFTMTNTTDVNGVFNLNAGNNSTDVYVDNISISEVSAGTACDDGDACTVNDAYDAACNCIGTYVDADADGYCAANDPDDNDACNPDTCIPPQCELVQNGDFTNGITDWTLYKYGSANGNLSVAANGYAEIDVTNAGTSTWHLALRQSGLFLEIGKTYYVRISAYADASRSCPIIISQSGGAQYAYIAQSLTTTPTVYEYQFTMNDATDANANFSLNVGNNSTTVYVDNISISEAQDTNCDDNDVCTVNDTYDANCNCIGIYQDADGDGYCAANDPDDNDPCNPDDCDLGACELIQNWNFDNGTADWTMYQHSSANGNLSVLGNGDAKIDVINAGTSSWHLALRQTGLTIENGKTYQIKLLAYADAARSCPIIISQSGGAQYAYIAQSLTTTPTVYEHQFTMNNATDTNAYFNLNVGNNSTDVYVSEVSLSEVGCVPFVDANCPTIENLTGNATTNATHHATQSIYSDATINADVIYKAGEKVELKSGFSTNPANNFTGEIEDCDGN